jgi:hypothetical protein
LQQGRRFDGIISFFLRNNCGWHGFEYPHLKDLAPRRGLDV